MTATPRLYTLCAAAVDGHFPPARREIEAGRGLVGALLVQGALAGRLELRRDRVRLTGRGGSGDPALDEFLDRLRSSSPGYRTPADWVRALGLWALAALHPGSRPPGRPAPPSHLRMRPGEALRTVRTAVEEPGPDVLTAVAAGALLTATGLHGPAWPDLARAEAARRSLRSAAALGPAGVPVALAATAVSDSLRSSATALAFPG
ncbi:GPP34 family phosphoprotein [Streptomyces sp. NPDC046557]|uniref:GPP34 family phosphoprotein n=1 Tax=Streptomyces sp. NPDC046557 TaxID=3155372 RepID=UPI0033C7C450